MQWLNKMIGRGGREARLAELAEKVAARSLQSVWQRVAHRVSTMRAAEARGYIRVRAAAVLQQEIGRVVADQSNWRGRLPEARLLELASEAVIRLVAAQQRVRQPLVMPLGRAA